MTIGAGIGEVQGGAAGADRTAEVDYDYSHNDGAGDPHAHKEDRRTSWRSAATRGPANDVEHLP